jgi:hypothetical protein
MEKSKPSLKNTLFSKNSIFLPVVINLYTFLNSVNLIETWQTSPLDRFGWLAFIIWLIPIPAYYIYCLIYKSKIRINIPYLAFGLFLSFASLVTDFEFLSHAGMAFTLAGCIPFYTQNIFWLISALLWMPFFGQIGTRYFYDYILILRLVITLLITLLAIFGLRRRLKVETSPTMLEIPKIKE